MCLHFAQHNIVIWNARKLVARDRVHTTTWTWHCSLAKDIYDARCSVTWLELWFIPIYLFCIPPHACVIDADWHEPNRRVDVVNAFYFSHQIVGDGANVIFIYLNCLCDSNNTRINAALTEIHGIETETLTLSTTVLLSDQLARTHSSPRFIEQIFLAFGSVFVSIKMRHYDIDANSFRDRAATSFHGCQRQ